jgi:hypothetical protein
MLFAVSSAVYGSEWAHNAINLTHEFGDGSGVKVGVLDGVTRCSHQELSGRCENYFPDAFTGEYYSDHGTHVATIIAGKDKAPDWVGHDGGVAPKAKIYNYAVFGSSWGTSDAWWISDEVEAEMANLAASHGVTVINQSYGDYNAQGRPYLYDAIVDIWRSHKDIIFVNAAGNDGTVLDPGDVKNIDNVIFVGASDQSGRIAGWSNRPGNNYKDQFIVAPGDFISGGFAGGDAEYGWMSGTSMAAPIVTGVIAILHDHWGHLKGDPSATAGILFESATDMGAPGVDKIYGHGMLNINGIFEPIAIVDEPGGGDDGDECDDTVIVIVDPPAIGTPGDGVWFDSRGRQHISDCVPTDDDDVVITNPGTTIGTPGDGVWFDSRGRSYFAMEVNGERRVLRRMKASSVLIPAASDLSVVFFDRYGRDYKTNAANYQGTRRVSEFMDLNDTMALQFVAGENPNFKMKFDDISVGKSRTMGFDNNPVLAMLDDGAFISNGKVGVMHSDTATTALYKPEDWLTLTFVKENGFLGSTGVGKYDTISSTVKKDYGMFFGSTTMAVSKGEAAGGIVKMSDTVTSLAFETGMKMAVNDRLNWQFSISQDLQPVDGSMSVSYDNKHGRNVTRTIDMEDYRDTKFMFKINYTW